MTRPTFTIRTSTKGTTKAIKRIKDIKKFLGEPTRNNIWHRKLNGWEKKFSNDVDRLFIARSSMGLYRDRLLNDALRINITKNKFIVYIDSISRPTKEKGRSSGGAVQDLTTILFNGTGSSFGAYYRKWDARVQTGVHPGVSSSIMRNMWKNYKSYIEEQIVKTLNMLVRKKIKELKDK